MDAQTCTIETAALAALVQAHVRLHAERGRRSESATPEALAENRFLAARDGIAAQFIDCARGGRRAATDRLAEVLCDCHPIARELRSSPELDALTALTAEPAHARQRSIASRHGLVGLTAALGAQFAPAPHGLVAA
jgi:carboxylate-amine ligase